MTQLTEVGVTAAQMSHHLCAKAKNQVANSVEVVTFKLLTSRLHKNLCRPILDFQSFKGQQQYTWIQSNKCVVNSRQTYTLCL